MRGDKMFDVVDFILNEASEADLEVVREALKRRLEGNPMRGAMGVDPGRMARGAAAGIREQMGLSVDKIRGMVRAFAAEVVKKNAPELDRKQVAELLDSWVGEIAGGRETDESGIGPGGGTGAGAVPGGSAGGSGSGRSIRAVPGGMARRGGSRLAPEVVLTMVLQFLSFSTESMSVRQQIGLNEQIPDWQRKYWDQFKPRIRKLLGLFLNGEIDKATCVERVRVELGMEPA